MDHFMFGEPPVFGFVLPVCARRFATKGSLVCACRFAPKKFIGLIPSVCARRPDVML